MNLNFFFPIFWKQWPHLRGRTTRNAVTPDNSHKTLGAGSLSDSGRSFHISEINFLPAKVGVLGSGLEVKGGFLEVAIYFSFCLHVVFFNFW